MKEDRAYLEQLASELSAASFHVTTELAMGDPATDAERHRRISPLFHAANIRRPMLVVQGANDPRVLQVESDELVAAVRRNDVPVDYVLFPELWEVRTCL